MSDSAVEMTHNLLVLVGEFLKKLPAEQYDDLMSGEARLAVIPKGARVGAATAAGGTRRAAAPKPAPVPAAQIAEDLAKIEDRGAATRYLDDLKLTVPQLKQICKELDVPVASKATRADATRALVEVLVGRRADSAAIMRHSSAGRA